MIKAIVGFIAGAITSTAFAQSAMQTPAVPAKQQVVASITQQAAKGADISPFTAGTTADLDKTMKSEPKVLTSNTDRQLVAQSTTIHGSQGFQGRRNGLAADRDQAEKGEPRVLTTWSQEERAAHQTTVAAAHDH